MMNTPPLAIRNLALKLLALEVVEGKPSENTAFNVCEKFRTFLTTLMGAAGYRALISRALSLAQKEDPSLEKVQVKEDGRLEWTGAAVPEQGIDEAAQAEAVLGTQLLSLLVIFIGPALTMRLVREQWPDVLFEDINCETEKQL